MDILNSIFLVFIIIGILGGFYILIALATMGYNYLEGRMLKKRIPDKIKKEVEDDRIKRETNREQFRRTYSGEQSPQGNDNGAADERVSEQSESNKQPDSNNVGQNQLDIQHPDVRDIGQFRSAGKKLREKFSKKKVKEIANETDSN